MEGDDLGSLLELQYLGRERHRGGFAVHCVVYSHVDKGCDWRREENKRTDVLLVPSTPVQLFSDLNHLAVELVAGRCVTCAHVSHNRASVMWPLWKEKKTRATKGRVWGRNRKKNIHFPHQGSHQ